MPQVQLPGQGRHMTFRELLRDWMLSACRDWLTVVLIYFIVRRVIIAEWPYTSLGLSTHFKGSSK